MKHLVIIVDDQINKRRTGYERFAEKISMLQPGFEIQPVFVEDPNQLQLMIQRDHYSAAIVDAVLDEYWKSFTVTRALKILGNEIPIALLSEQWDKTNAEQIDEAWKKPNCRTFLHWRDIDPKGNGQIDYAVRAFVSMIADNKKLDIQHKLEHDESIRIVHISDVQTGGFDEKRLKSEANICADHILEHWADKSPTFVAFTGDVAEHGAPSQYKAAHEWISYFFERLSLNKLPASNLLYVPGNHDVNLCLAGSTRIQLIFDKITEKHEFKLDDKLHQPELLGYSYSPFRNFWAGISDCKLLEHDDSYHSLAWVESRYRHLGIIFYGINTAQPANAFGLPNREVNSNDLNLIKENIQPFLSDCGDTPPLVVGLGHHCPVPAGGDSAVVNPEDFELFFRGRVKTALFLHGHTHDHDLSYMSNNGLRIVRSCATTLTKKENTRPSDSLRGFNLLEMTRENHVIKSLNAFSFGWLGNDIKELKKDSWERQRDGMFREKI